MACVLPEARFLGIELAARPVGIGRGLAAALALSNVELRQGDVLDLPADLGEFDYIVAHGVYSWVSASVRDALMAAFARHLAPEGVAYLNFNAFPGGHLRNLVRDMMRFRLAAFDDPEAHGEDAVRFVRTVAEAQPEGSPYRRVLEEELERIEGNPAGVLFHDDLAPDHQAFHFRHVAGHAARHGLQYLCEARPADVHPGRYPAAVRAALRRTGGDRIAAALRRSGGERIAAALRRGDGDRIAAVPPSTSTASGDPASRRSGDDHSTAASHRTGDARIAREQCFDFLVCQMYRCSLFCREGIALAPHADPERMSDLRAASVARPDPAPADLTDGIPVAFRAPDGAAARIDDSAAKAALELLAGRWPASVELEALLRDARRRAGRTGRPTPLERREFAAFLASGPRLGARGPPYLGAPDDDGGGRPPGRERARPRRDRARPPGHQSAPPPGGRRRPGRRRGARAPRRHSGLRDLAKGRRPRVPRRGPPRRLPPDGAVGTRAPLPAGGVISPSQQGRGKCRS